MSDTRSKPVLTIGQLKAMLAAYPDDAEVIIRYNDDYSEFGSGDVLTVSTADEYVGQDLYTIGEYLDYALSTDEWRRVVQYAQSSDYDYMRAREDSIKHELYSRVRDAASKKVLITMDGANHD